MSVDGVRAIVLSYGPGRDHEPLLASLSREGVADDRIVVVHNPSARGEVLASPPERSEVIEASHNLGYAAAMNLGLGRQLQRDCELVLVLTQDARFRPGALRRLVEAAAESPGHGVLGPVLLLAGTEEAFSCGGVTGRSGQVAHNRQEPPASRGIVDCNWVDGGTMLIRAEALRQVGCFDERFWGYFEDADLCLRIVRAGFAVGVVVDAWADQEPGGSKRRGSWAYLITRNGIAYAQRFAGARGGFSATARAAFGVGVELLRTVARIARLRSGPPAETWAVAVGTLRGIVAFHRRSWGPPPPGLPGGGDIRNLAPPVPASDAR